MADIKIGEVFKFRGKIYILKENKNYDCNNCAFKNMDCLFYQKNKAIPECIAELRKDKIEAEFIEVKMGHWKCKNCGGTKFTHQSSYDDEITVTCEECGNEGSDLSEVMEWEENDMNFDIIHQLTCILKEIRELLILDDTQISFITDIQENMGFMGIQYDEIVIEEKVRLDIMKKISSLNKIIIINHFIINSRGIFIQFKQI